MKTLSELNIMQYHDEFEFMLIPTCNDYYIDNCEFYYIAVWTGEPISPSTIAIFDNFNI